MPPQARDGHVGPMAAGWRITYRQWKRIVCSRACTPAAWEPSDMMAIYALQST